MATLNDEADEWEDGVYQIETTDPVLGGAPNPSTGAGMSNIPHLQLARRTLFLKAQLDELLLALEALQDEFDSLSGGPRSAYLPVLVATTANIALTGLQTIDGVSVLAGRRVLVKNQTAPAENGLYIAGSGAWSRATDMDSSAKTVPGALIPVTSGTAQGDTLWMIASPNEGTAVVLGTTALTFSNVTALMAPLASPALTGTPTAPTAAVDTDNTQVATTAFVIAQAGSADPLMAGTLAVGTSKRFARQDHRHPSDTSRAAVNSPTFTGSPAAPTPAQFDNDTSIATTAFVQRALGNHSSALLFTGNQTLTAANAGICLVYADASAVAVTLPAIAGVAVGATYEIINSGTGIVTLQRAGADEIDSGPSLVTSIAIPPNTSLKIVRAQSATVWHLAGISAQAMESTMAASLTSNGWQRLPSGLLMQWGSVSGEYGDGGTAVDTFSFPIAYPTACLQMVGIEAGSTDIINEGHFGLTPLSTTQFRIWAFKDTALDLNYTARWFSVGH